MARPHDVLAQLLSPQQADALKIIGDRSWEAIARVLEAVMDAAPAVTAADGRLVMPDEIIGDYSASHVVVPVRLDTRRDQSAMAFVTFATPEVAAFLDSASDDVDTMVMQTSVIGAAIAGQVVQGINKNVFGDSPIGLELTAQDIVADAMPSLLMEIDEPALALSMRLGDFLGISVVLPGTFLDIMAGALPEEEVAPAAAPAIALDLPFSLTEDELDAAEIVDFADIPAPAARPQAAPQAVPAFAGVSSTPAMASTVPDPGAPLYQQPQQPGYDGLPPRAPTPISNAPTAQRARFAPLPEADGPGSRNNMDLLSALELNVTVELGRTELTVAEVLGLGPGSVIELDRLAGEPVDILVNDRIIARGEVVVVDENFGVRVVEVLRRGHEEERAS